MVLRLESLGCEIADCADLLDDDIVVLAAFGGFGLDDVGELPHRGGVFLGRLVGGVLVFGDLGGQGLGLGDDRGLLVRGSRGDFLALGFLRGAGLFVLAQRVAARFIGLEHLVDEFDRFSALALGILNDIRMFADEIDIKHIHKITVFARHASARKRHSGAMCKVRGILSRGVHLSPWFGHNVRYV